MIQFLLGNTLSAPSNSATQYGLWPVQQNQFSGSLTAAKTISSFRGKLRNFIATVDIAPGVGKDWAVGFFNDTLATSVVASITGTNLTGRNTTDALTVSLLDLLHIQTIPTGTPAAIGNLYWNAEFIPDVYNESSHVAAHATGNGALSGSGGPYYLQGPFCGVTWNTTTPPTTENEIAADGTITSLIGYCPVVPGAGSSWEFYLVKNGVVQDGTGGTTDTKCVVADSNPSNRSTFSLAVVKGDTVSSKAVTVASPSSTRIQTAVTFVATNPDEFMFVSVYPSPGAVNTYSQFASSSGGAWDATEANVVAPAWVNTMQIQEMRTRLATAPGGVTSRTFLLRTNSSASLNPLLQCLISGVNTTDTSSAGRINTFMDGNTLSLNHTPSGAPTGSVVSVSYRANRLTGWMLIK